MALLDWPGKSPATQGGPMHPAAFHMLDVAAVAEVLLGRELLHAPIKSALAFLVALHDLGKINADFRAMIEGATRQGKRHWEVSEILLLEARPVLAAALRPEPTALSPSLEAVAGHHGRPSNLNVVSERHLKLKRVGKEALAEASTLIQGSLRRWLDASLLGLVGAAGRLLSWWLPGLTATGCCSPPTRR